MARYRSFIAWYCKRFGLLIAGDWVTPAYLFKFRLVNFAATVCGYFTQEHPTTQRESELKRITPLLVKRMFRRHLQPCWTDLTSTFDRLLADPSPFLYHTTPLFRIIRKTNLVLLKENLADRTENREFHGAPIYSPADSPPLPGEAAQKRVHISTASPQSPSQQKVLKKRR